MYDNTLAETLSKVDTYMYEHVCMYVCMYVYVYVYVYLLLTRLIGTYNIY